MERHRTTSPIVISMQQNKFDISKLGVSKPCPIPWESMIGNDRVRKCDTCQLNIFNIESMTTSEVEKLISSSQPYRLCIRLVRRADGTVMTRDCPKGLSAYRKRLTSLVTVSIAAVLSAFSVSYGQHKDANTINNGVTCSALTINQTGSSCLTGLVTDVNGATIPKIRIRLFLDKAKRPLKETYSDNEGRFSFTDLMPGTYLVEIPKKMGFKKAVMENIIVVPNKQLAISMIMEPATTSVTVGIFVQEPMIDLSVSGPTPTVITSSMIDKIPGGRPY